MPIPDKNHTPYFFSSSSLSACIHMTWTLEEDQKLLAAVKLYGRKPKVIQREVFAEKEYNNVKKRMSETLPPIDPTTAPKKRKTKAAAKKTAKKTTKRKKK